MIWASLVFGFILVIVLSSALVWVAVRILQSSQDAFRTLDSISERDSQDRNQLLFALKGLTDRLMSQDWEAVRLHESGETDEPDGGFFEPEDQASPEQETVVQYGGWGNMNAPRDLADRLDADETLLREDFPAEFAEPHENR